MINLHEFYQQLGLLVKSKLPLPEAMRQLERTLKGPLYKNIEMDLEKGVAFHSALAKYPDSFPENHLELIRLAEENNTLSETLNELAKYSHFERIIQTKIKDILFYPVLVLMTSLVILGVVGQFFLYPLTQDIFNEEGMNGPVGNAIFYQLATELGVLTHDYTGVYWTVTVLIFIFLLLVIFNVFNIKALNNMWLKITSLWTDFSSLFNSSRLCSFLSLQFKNKISLHDSCNSAKAIVVPELARELQLCHDKLKQGADSKEIFQDCFYLDPLIISTLENCTESDLSNEMSKLSDHYFERVYTTSERLVTYWKILTTLLTALLVFILMQIMMSPMLILIRNM